MAQRTPGKVALIGTGMVGSSFAYSLMQRSLASELVLIDKDFTRAEGEAMDLNHGLPFVRAMRIYAGDYSDLAGAEVIVVAAGANQHPGQSRLELLQINANVFRDIIPRILEVNDTAQIVVATNPVDLLTTISVQIAGPQRVIGSGTILDTARFRFLLGEYYGVDPRSVHSYIIGEHGDSSVPLWSLANVAGMRLRDFVAPNGKGYDAAAFQQIYDRVQKSAYEIIQRKRATYYAIGLGLLTIVEAILRDQHMVMTVSSVMKGQYGISDVAISLPTLVGRNGVEEVLNLPLSDEESVAFRRSAGILQERLAEIS